jgi:PPK2 family polyphosphate:nucleotide phosphotransferase
MSDLKDFIQPFEVKPGSKVSLKKDFDPDYTGDYTKKDEAVEKLQEGIRLLAAYQDKLYAQNTHALLIVLQARDAAGKDSVIKHVMSGLNPQGCQVYSFKTPSAEELDHDYLWRCFKALPERGRIGIFNRSHYEEVLVVRVHPEFLDNEHLPKRSRGKGIWTRRFQEINNFEHYLVDNGIVMVKFFLNLSKKEQKQRFLDRIDQPDKNWKFSTFDCKERALWDEFDKAYEEMLTHTSTKWAPWYVIPADHKWFTRLAVASVIIQKMREIDPQYPTLNEGQEADLLKAKEMLESEEEAA